MTPPSERPDVQGDLQRYPLPRLFFYLLKKAFLGRLDLTTSGVTASVYLRDGIPVYTSHPAAVDTLGRIFLERGLINEAIYNRALEELAATGQPEGQILLRMGAIDQPGLVGALKVQLHRKLNRLFAIREAQIALHSGEHDYGLENESTLVQADPLRVIYHGVRNHYDASRLAPELDKLRRHGIRLRNGFEKRKARYTLGQEDEALVLLLSHTTMPLEQVLRVTNSSPLETEMLIYVLWVTEALVATPLAAVASEGQELRPQSFAVLPAVKVPSPPPRSMTPSFDTPSLPAEPRTTPGIEALAQSFSEETSVPVSWSQPVDAAEAVPGAEATPLIMLPSGELLEIDVAMARPEHREEAPPPIIVPAPIIVPPPPDVAVPAPIIVPPPPDAVGPAAIIVPPPPDAVGLAPIIVLPAPIILGPAPDAAASGPVIVPSSPSPTRLDPSTPPGREVSVVPSLEAFASGDVASRSPARVRRPTTGTQAAAPPSAQAIMEHRSLIKKAHARMKNKDHYQVLEVGRDASTELIRDVYFKLAKIYHPDRCAALGLSDLVPVAEEVFRRVNEAHSILSNPETRKAYEAENEGGGESEEARRALEAEFAFQKGVVLFRKKAYAEALREFEEACRLNDKEAEHLAWLAWTRFCDPKSDRVAILPRVKEQLLQATRIAPKNPTCHYFLGEVHLALGDERRAKISFAHTVELQEGHVEANRHLRIMQMRKDKKEKEESKGIFGRFKKK